MMTYLPKSNIHFVCVCVKMEEIIHARNKHPFPLFSHLTFSPFKLLFELTTLLVPQDTTLFVFCPNIYTFSPAGQKISRLIPFFTGYRRTTRAMHTIISTKYQIGPNRGGPREFIFFCIKKNE